MKITAKIYVFLFLFVLSLFLFFHLIIWFNWTSQIFDRDDKYYIGDLGRLGYVVDSLHPRKLKYTLAKSHLDGRNFNFESVDLITIGDSFSNADTGGLNPYYQDYFASLYGLKVLNLRRDTENISSFDVILALVNDPKIDILKPKAILIESAQRFVYKRLGKEFNFITPKYNLADFTYLVESKKTVDSHIPKLLPINTANYKFIFAYYKYINNEHPVNNVYYAKLDRNLFSINNFKSKLLYHRWDIENICNSQKDVNKINENLNYLAKLLKLRNITLYFMPAVDKYDLYYDFIVEKKYPKNNFFDLIRPMKKEYYFIDTKEILQKMLKQGELDIYYADDTHWSYKASEAIVKSMKGKI